MQLAARQDALDESARGVRDGRYLDAGEPLDGEQDRPQQCTELTDTDGVV